MKRQVKKYGRDALAPPLHAHDGLDKTSVDNEVFSRALVLKGKGEKTDRNKKQTEPTYRLGRPPVCRTAPEKALAAPTYFQHLRIY